MAWSRKLSAPIVLDDGRAFSTLREAADYVLGLGPVAQNSLHWRLAAEMMMEAAKPAATKAKLQEAERLLKNALRAQGALDWPGVRNTRKGRRP
jgi:hypothetical protein